MGTPEGAVLAMTLLIVWVVFWALILRRALRALMRQRLIERVLLDRIERIERGEPLPQPASAPRDAS